MRRKTLTIYEHWTDGKAVADNDGGEGPLEAKMQDGSGVSTGGETVRTDAGANVRGRDLGSLKSMTVFADMHRPGTFFVEVSSVKHGVFWTASHADELDAIREAVERLETDQTRHV